MTITPDYNRRINEALVEQETLQTQPDEIVELSTGVKLKLLKIPVLTIHQVASKFKFPDPPKTYIEDKGRWENNPHDPHYLRMCEQVDQERGLAVVDAIAALGTEIIECPSNVQSLEDNEWIDDLRVIGIEVPTQGRGRYLAWIKHCAVVDVSDLEVLTEKFGYNMGISERGIDEQIRSNFPSN